MFAAGFACCEDLAIKAPRMFPQTAQHLSRCPQLLLVVLDLAGPDQSGQRCADEHPFSVDRIGGAIVAVPVRAGRRHRSSCGRLALGLAAAMSLALFTLRSVLPLRSV